MQFLIIEKINDNFYILNNTITDTARAYCMDLEKALQCYIRREKLENKAFQIITI